MVSMGNEIITVGGKPDGGTGMPCIQGGGCIRKYMLGDG